ncbi:MAG: SIS domain-containing protein [Candidatus Eisenbacteria bacterium]|nr:SIS domain-containing protein [Candidatus Eisenbacteria bacterium]
MKDWRALRERHDRADMFDRIRGLPEQIEDAVARFRVEGAEPEGSDLRNVLLLGMGGSAIGGEIAAALLRPTAGIPVCVVRGPEVPAWCGPDTLALAASYSGETEETAAAAARALERGARLAVVASGGELLARAEARGLPRVSIPSGFPPRAAIGYLAASVLLLLERAGVGSEDGRALRDAARLLGAQRDEWKLGGAPCESAPAEAARSLFGLVPYVYYAEGEMAPVAARWCGQLAENAKTLAHRAAFPEANHNEIVGWERADGIPPIGLVLLTSEADPPSVRRGMEGALRMMKESARIVLCHVPRGDRPLARILSGIYFGDFVSYFLALLHGVDPTPVLSIDRLKLELAAERGGKRADGRDGRERL